MTAPTMKSNSNGRSKAAAEQTSTATLDIPELSGQLGQISGALDQLQSDNEMLTDSLRDSQQRLVEAQDAARAAKESAANEKKTSTRLEAKVDRRDAEITALGDELAKIRSERIDWESGILAERDAAIEQQQGELISARQDLRALKARIVDLEDELALERQRTAPDRDLVQLMTTAGTTLLVDGESMLGSSWPELAPERRRGRLIDAVSRFQQRHQVGVELLLGDSEGWDPSAELPIGLRVRVPHDGIPIPACLARLASVYESRGPVVTVSDSYAEEPWISSARAAALIGLPVAHIPVGDKTTSDDLKPLMEVEK